MRRSDEGTGGSAGAAARLARSALLAAAAAALAACGGDGAGSGASGTGATQTPPASSGGGTGVAAALSVVVSGAVPTSGNALVTGSAGTSSPLSGTVRRLVADGSGNGLQHRFTVDYDAVTGIVIAVTHGWGASTSALDASTLCVRAVTAAGQAVCGDTVSVDGLARRVTFTGTVLRGAGTFSSILTGQISYTVP